MRKLNANVFDRSRGLTGARVRVLHCIPTLKVGGAETQVRLLSPQLAARGLDVGIFARMDDRDVATLSRAGVTCFPIRTRGHYNPLIVGELLRAMRALRPTVVQTWLTQMDILGGGVALARRIPWVVSERSSPPCYTGGRKDRLRIALGNRADLLVANAIEGLAVWPGHRNGRVIGNGVDLAAIEGVPAGLLRDTEAFRDRIVAISVSRLVADKNVDVLIGAMALIRDAMPELRLVIVGDGPDRDRLTALVAAQGLGDAVRFVGFQSRPLEWVRSADMFVSASRYEGHPNAVTEAAAGGVPTILSDIPMHRSLMNDAALYAPTTDAAAFAAHLVALARSRDARVALAAAGRREIARFDIDAVAALYADAYARLSTGAAPAA